MCVARKVHKAAWAIANGARRQTDRQRSLPLGILHSTVRGTVVWNIVVVLPYGYYYRTWYTGRARTWTRVGNGIRDTGDWRLETPGSRKEGQEGQADQAATADCSRRFPNRLGLGIRRKSERGRVVGKVGRIKEDGNEPT